MSGVLLVKIFRRVLPFGAFHISEGEDDYRWRMGQMRRHAMLYMSGKRTKLWGAGAKSKEANAGIGEKEAQTWPGTY